jgi:hypothetical protein
MSRTACTELQCLYKGALHLFTYGKKGKVTSLQARLWPRRGKGLVLLFQDHGIRRGEGSASRPGRSLPPGKTRYLLYRRLGGPQGRSGRAENLAPTWIRSPDRPARSSVAIPTELPGPLLHMILTSNMGNSSRIQHVPHFPTL